MSLRTFISKSKNFSSFVNKDMKQTLRNQYDYDACIEVLNSLQSNAHYVKFKSKPTGSHNSEQLIQVKKFLTRTGVSLNKLDELSAIHIAGTKGKGTTCAFSERILREHGYKTGFFSSPHLLEVRERIRIDGQPIDKHEFAKYFWKVYSALDQQKTDEGDIPFYFRFLTIMAFNIFLEKKVDVAIIEVGIGGEYDCTNVLRKVPVVGITSLGLDHTSILGTTIDSIAWNKAGIMKEGCRAFTVPQPEAAMNVLKERSIERKCQLDVIDNLQFKLPPNPSSPAHILNLNASLAVALCEAWLAIKHNNNALNQLMSKEITETALSNCVWPGRFQVKHGKTITYYLDGAHTLESIAICSNWFKEITKHSKRKRALMFNVTGNRDAENLLQPLKSCNFDAVLFVPNKATNNDKFDNMNFKPVDELLEKCQQHKQLWLKLEPQDENVETKICEIFSTVIEAVGFLSNQDQYDLLVTGSLHLVGSVLSIVNPNMNEELR